MSWNAGHLKESRSPFAAGAKITTKKSVEAKKLMQEYNRDFDGTLNDIDTMTQIRARVGTRLLDRRLVDLCIYVSLFQKYQINTPII